LFDDAGVYKIRAHREKENDATVFDCDIHLEARVTR
jgi:hypothetical protein